MILWSIQHAQTIRTSKAQKNARTKSRIESNRWLIRAEYPAAASACRDRLSLSRRRPAGRHASSPSRRCAVWSPGGHHLRGADGTGLAAGVAVHGPEEGRVNGRLQLGCSKPRVERWPVAPGIVAVPVAARGRMRLQRPGRSRWAPKPNRTMPVQYVRFKGKVWCKAV